MPFIFAAIASVALFSFLAVAVWSSAHRREREAYYRNDAVKKIAESQGAGGPSAMDFLHEEERYSTRRRQEGRKLGGLISVAVGLSMMIFIKAVDHDPEPNYLVGLIPLLIGVAVLAYAYLLAPNEERFRREQ